MLFAQAIRLVFVLADGIQQLIVGLLARQELGYDLLHVALARSSPDLLECVLDEHVLAHFLLHFLF